MYIGALYAGAILSYYTYAWITYHEGFKNSAFFIPTGLILALAGNLLWMVIAKQVEKQSDLFMAGLVFDLIVTSSFIFTPFLFFGLSLPRLAYVGLFLSLSGLVILKVSLSL